MRDIVGWTGETPSAELKLTYSTVNAVPEIQSPVYTGERQNVVKKPLLFLARTTMS